jgi:F0F1-type ATP synthase assembly protein I
MELSMSALALEMVYSVLLGVFLAVVYDAMYLLRDFFSFVKFQHFSPEALPVIKRFLKTKKENRNNNNNKYANALQCLSDILFFLFAGVVFSVFIYHFNDGVIRGFIFIFSALGFALYRISCRRLVLRIFEFILELTRILLLYALFLVIYPICAIFAKLYAVFFYLISKIFLIIIKMYDIIIMHTYNYYKKHRLGKFFGGF